MDSEPKFSDIGTSPSEPSRLGPLPGDGPAPRSSLVAGDPG